MKNAFYKTNGFVGSSVMFWAIDGLGYTSNIDLAELYTREQVQRDVDNDYLASFQKVTKKSRTSAGRGTGIRTECLWISPNCKQSKEAA